MTEAALYFTEFTMNDGTTRRALVERCPECRPTRDGRGLLFIDEMGFRWGSGKMTAPVAQQEDAAALCRCQVEDWLIQHGESLWVEHDEDGWSVQEFSDYYGLTIHHALICACHAVLDSQGCPA